MKLTERKLLTIICESSIESRLIHDLKELGMKGYTLFECQGEGNRGVRRGDWEQGKNSCIQIICKEDQADLFFTHIHDNYYEDYVVIAYLSNVDVHRESKF